MKQIRSKANINVCGIPPVLTVKIDFDDIAQKRDALLTNSLLFNEPIEIILEFPRGDFIYGLPVRYTMKRRRRLDSLELL